MPQKKLKQSKSVELVLDETIEISNLASFYDQLSKHLRSSNPVIVNAGKVKRVDTSALQLLCSWYKAALEKNIVITWKHADGTLRSSATRLGLAKYLCIE